MLRIRYSAELIVQKFREAEVRPAQGLNVKQMCDQRDLVE